MEIVDITQEKAINREWIVTNGIGGYSSSTISGCNTRKYHGLLVASLNPPVSRLVLVNCLFEKLNIKDESFDCSTHKFDVIHPQGFKFLKNFTSTPLPKFEMDILGNKITKKIFMIYGKNITVIDYSITCIEEGSFQIYPLISCRGLHEVKTKDQDPYSPARELDSYKGGTFETIRLYDSSPYILIGTERGNYEPSSQWFNNFNYEQEKERGYPFAEDLLNPSVISIPLARGKNEFKIVFMASEDKKVLTSEFYDFMKKKDHLVEHEADRIKQMLHHFYNYKNIAKNQMLDTLLMSADQFIVHRRSTGKKTVIAGYHWFDDWGRDTLISLDGLCLETGRFNEARNILTTFAVNVKNGLVPNMFMDNNQVIYNNVDSSLWFFIALYKYFLASKDRSFVEEMYPVMKEVIECYFKGTDFCIKADIDGLVNLGSAQFALTWMDAKMGDYVVTPRNGKPVEIQALWFNCLKIFEFFSVLCHKEFIYDELIIKVKSAFNLKFWNDSNRCLYDVVNNGQKDPSIRPNQVFAVSLPFSILNREKEKLVVDCISKKLLSTYGLLTLSKDDPKYKGYYSGDQNTRDNAYHQGTIWPWLFGHYIEAYLKVNNYSNEAIAECKHKVDGMLELMEQYGVGSLPEIVEAETLAPKGCISQAWSVAEAIRAYILVNSKY